MTPKKIVIVGLGLMGASLAADCRRKFPRAQIAGVSRSARAVQTARKKGWIHEGDRSLKKILPGTDFVILCTPVQTIPEYIAEIEKYAAGTVYVTDVGSVKGSIEDAARRMKLRKVVFLGAHPMVGSHEKGVGAARPGLYDNGLIFLVKKNKNALRYKPLKTFWSRFSRRIVEIDPREHDRIVAEISHLPHVLAACLAQSLSFKSGRFASSGFKDTTRIAAGHESIWLPILIKNRQEVLKTIKSYQKKLDHFRKSLEKGSAAQVEAFLRRGRLKREQI